MILFPFIVFLSLAAIVVLFQRHIGGVGALSEAELDEKIKLGPSPFIDIEEKVLRPAGFWFSRHLPFFLMRTVELAVREVRRTLLKIAVSLGGVHDYLRGRNISLNNSRKSAYWNEIHNDVKNGNNGSDTKNQ